ncbi:MAG: lipid A biosynthesis acyltransferase [Planctomycetota bacterium]|nr:MAG: lipid A biosynthesis acyltransferase [Planctomycetota bacterium]
MQRLRRRLRHAGHYTVYVVLRVFLCILQTTDLQSCDRICRLVAWILADLTRVRRSIIDENLNRVYPDLAPRQRRLLRKSMWHHLLLMLCEIAHAPRKIHRCTWLNHFRMRNKSMMVRSIIADHPTLLTTGHFGNFEIAGYAMGVFGIPAATVARPLDNPIADAYLTQFRCSGGQVIFPKDGSAHLIQEHLERRGNLAILADQFAGSKGVWIEFFGHPTSCHKAVALFVLSAGATMSVTYNRRLGRPLRFELGCIDVCSPNVAGRQSTPPHLQSVESLTEWYNAQLEASIRLAPEQYWWLHRRWREVPASALRRLQRRREQNRTIQSPSDAPPPVDRSAA